MKGYSYLLFPLLLLASTVQTNAISDDCGDGTQQLTFEFFSDIDSSREQSWVLSCDDGTIPWELKRGDYPYTWVTRRRWWNYWRQPVDNIREDLCLADDVTCTFTIEDSYGDGLLEGGYYALIHGSTTVAAYDHSAFEEKAYCVGPSCPVPPIEEEEQCEWLYFYLRLDGLPAETSYTVTCDGEPVLGGSGFTVAVQEIEEEVCIPVSSCCTVTVTDTGNDGLTSFASGGEEEDGEISVYFLSNKVVHYKGNSGEEFSVLEKSFGLGCED